MSFRPTISAYFTGHIADIGYYRNWGELSLLFEAVIWYAEYHDCRTKEEYRERRFGCQDVSYILDPEEIEGSEENLKDLERCSEFPIIIDFTAKYIYVNEGALSIEELERRPSVLESKDKLVQDITVKSDFYEILSRYKIPLRHINPKEILAAINSPDAWSDEDSTSSEAVSSTTDE